MIYAKKNRPRGLFFYIFLINSKSSMAADLGPSNCILLSPSWVFIVHTFTLFSNKLSKYLSSNLSHSSLF